MNINIDPRRVDFKKENKWLIPIGVSNRHVHLSQKDIDILFGKGYQLTVAKELSQKGEFAARETVNVVGSKGVLEKVRIVGPLRSQTQIELSRTDAFKIGLNAPIRNSGDLADTPGCILIGPKSPLVLDSGCIIPGAHIHMTKQKAELLDLNDRDQVSVLIKSSKVVCYHNVLVRVSESAETEFHMDTDEANAAFVDTGDLAMIKHKEMVIKDNYGNIIEVGVDNIKFVRGIMPHDYASMEGIRLLRNIFHYPASTQQAIVNRMLNPNELDPNRFYLMAAMEEDKVVGIACFYYLAEAKMGYLEHIGIMPEYRKRGIGSFFYHKIISFLEKEHMDIEGVLLEVRQTESEIDSRKQFFLNLGAIPVDTSFYPAGKFKFAESLLLMFQPLVVDVNLNTPTLDLALRNLSKVLL